MSFAEINSQSDNSESLEIFERLLNGLSENREEAGRLYSQLHEKLERHFYIKSLAAPDVAADLTLERLGQVLLSKDETVEDITKFAFGIAKYIFLEQQRSEIKQRQAIEKLDINTGKNLENETFNDLAKICLAKLEPDEQQLLVDYFVDLPFAQCVLHREELAESLDTNVNNLRQKISNIKRKLEKYIDSERKTGENKARNAGNNVFRKLFS